MVGLENTLTGFALVTAAGLSTALGAAAVFFNRLVSLANKRVLAAGLGFSGGVMLYVSFVEILVKSQGAFKDDGRKEVDAYMCATACFFGGMILLRLLVLLVHLIDRDHDHHCHNEETIDVIIATSAGSANAEPGSSDAAPQEDPTPGGKLPAAAQEDAAFNKKLKTMGLNTAAAIAIHNFPEGLATFVATLADPQVGAMLAVAIAIHNIPEGLCVALPIYYATKNRCCGFLVALLSGISEPIGALIGYAILKGTGEDMNQTMYGALFGIVGGMMVMIVLLELIPTAHRYDPQDTCVTTSLIFGMMVMAVSLVMFQA